MLISSKNCLLTRPIERKSCNGNVFNICKSNSGGSVWILDLLNNVWTSVGGTDEAIAVFYTSKWVYLCVFNLLFFYIQFFIKNAKNSFN